MWRLGWEGIQLAGKFRGQVGISALGGIRPSAALASCLAVAFLLVAPGTAAAESIVFERDGNIWQAAPDGSNQVQITTAGGYTKPTQANDGTIVAEKADFLERMDRDGRVLNTAGDSDWGGPLNPHLSPDGQLVAYDYFRTAPSTSPGFHTSLSYSTRPTDHGEIFDISGWGRPSWIGNDRVLMFDASETFTGDTLIYTVGGSGTQTWYEDPDLSLSGGEVDASETRFAATDGVRIRIYTLTAPPPAIAVTPRCDLTGPNGSFFRPTWSPDGSALAWQEDDGIWVGRFDLTTCQGNASLVIPGGKAPDWGPANVPSSGNPPTPDPAEPPNLSAQAKKTQKAGKPIKVNVSSDKDASASAGGKVIVDRAKFALKKAKAELTAGETETMKLRPKSARNLAKIESLVEDGAKAKAKIKVTATDPAGASSSSKLAVKLKA